MFNVFCIIVNEREHHYKHYFFYYFKGPFLAFLAVKSVTVFLTETDKVYSKCNH